MQRWQMADDAATTGAGFIGRDRDAENGRPRKRDKENGHTEAGSQQGRPGERTGTDAESGPGKEP